MPQEPTYGELFAAFSRIRIGIPMIVEAQRLFDGLRSIARNRSGGTLPWAGIFGPPMTGKTVTVQCHCDALVRRKKRNSVRRRALVDGRHVH